MYLFLVSVFTLFLINSVSGTSLTQKSSSNVPANPAFDDKTKLSLPSEGGTLLASTPDLSLPKDKQLLNLLALDKELEKPKETSIKPRKGVDNFTDNHTILKNPIVHENSSSAIQGTDKVKSGSDPSEVINDFDVKKENVTVSTPLNITSKHKKPLILSYEALVSADKNAKNNEHKILAANPSSNTLSNVKGQISSPNEDEIIKVYPSKANSHPKMIMPIVITILVVPMFAIVGYLALKRGQEAWKNRHYKRMDFLLDGMYND